MPSSRIGYGYGTYGDAEFGIEYDGVPSSRQGYGYGPYGDNDFGVEGVLHDGVAVGLVTASATANGGFAVEASATINASASGSSGSSRVRNATALVSSTASTASVGEEFVLKVISEYDYGTGAYGGGYFGQGPLDTIAAGTASTTSDATRVRIASASISVTSSTSSAAVTVVDGDATVSSTATNTCTGSFSVVGAATGSATATITAICIRRRKSDALISSTSSTASVAREKWEPITAGAQNWVIISTSTDTWTKVA